MNASDEKLERLKAKQKDADGRVPACWSPYYWLMVYSHQQANKEIILPEQLIWNRYFCTDLSDEIKQKLGIPNVKPLNQDERQELLNFINKSLEKCKQGTISVLPDSNITPDMSSLYWDNDIEANFENFIFPHGVNLSKAKFYNAKFDKCEFKGHANFRQSLFLGEKADFWLTIFENEAYFFEAQFFVDAVSFYQTKFKGKTNFQEVSFGNKDKAKKEEQKIAFQKAEFTDTVTFAKSQFYYDTNLDEISQYCGDKTFSFRDAQFHKKLYFKSSNIQSKCFFSGAKFNEIDFTGAYFAKSLNFDNVDFSNVSAKEISLRVMRNAVKGEDNRQIELALFTKELEAWAQSEKAPPYVPVLIRMYGFFSDYGRSIARPIGAWGAFIGMFTLIYAILAWHIASGSSGAFASLAQAFLLSLRDSTLFLTLSDSEPHKKMIEALFCGGAADHCGVIRYYVYPFLQLIHKLISLPLIFLFGLGVRNALRT